MIPVCPACRASISLGAHVCGRCGLAVRPTCADCGEPLQEPAAACWYCQAPIEEPLVLPSSATRPSASSDRRVQALAAERRSSRREHVSFGRVLVEGFIAALLLTVAMLCLEAFAPKYTSTSAVIDELEPRTFEGLGFRVGVPSGWKVDTSKRAASFYSGEEIAEVSVRGFRIAPSQVAFADVPRESERADVTRFTSHDLVSTSKGKHGGRGTYTRVLHVEGRRIEQVWIDLRRGRSLRVEFWSRGADDDAAADNARILGTLELV